MYGTALSSGKWEVCGFLFFKVSAFIAIFTIKLGAFSPIFVLLFLRGPEMKHTLVSSLVPFSHDSSRTQGWLQRQLNSHSSHRKQNWHYFLECLPKNENKNLKPKMDLYVVSAYLCVIDFWLLPFQIYFSLLPLELSFSWEHSHPSGGYIFYSPLWLGVAMWLRFHP